MVTRVMDADEAGVSLPPITPALLSHNITSGIIRAQVRHDREQREQARILSQRLRALEALRMQPVQAALSGIRPWISPMQYLASTPQDEEALKYAHYTPGSLQRVEEIGRMMAKMAVPIAGARTFLKNLRPKRGQTIGLGGAVPNVEGVKQLGAHTPLATTGRRAPTVAIPAMNMMDPKLTSAINQLPGGRLWMKHTPTSANPTVALRPPAAVAPPPLRPSPAQQPRVLMPAEVQTVPRAAPPPSFSEPSSRMQQALQTTPRVQAASGGNGAPRSSPPPFQVAVQNKTYPGMPSPGVPSSANIPSSFMPPTQAISDIRVQQPATASMPTVAPPPASMQVTRPLRASTLASPAGIGSARQNVGPIVRGPQVVPPADNPQTSKMPVVMPPGRQTLRSAGTIQPTVREMPQWKTAAPLRLKPRLAKPWAGQAAKAKPMVSSAPSASSVVGPTARPNTQFIPGPVTPSPGMAGPRVKPAPVQASRWTPEQARVNANAAVRGGRVTNTPMSQMSSGVAAPGQGNGVRVLPPPTQVLPPSVSTQVLPLRMTGYRQPAPRAATPVPPDRVTPPMQSNLLQNKPADAAPFTRDNSNLSAGAQQVMNARSPWASHTPTVKPPVTTTPGGPMPATIGTGSASMATPAAAPAPTPAVQPAAPTVAAPATPAASTPAVQKSGVGSRMAAGAKKVVGGVGRVAKGVGTMGAIGLGGLGIGAGILGAGALKYLGGAHEGNQNMGYGIQPPAYGYPSPMTMSM